MSELTMNQGIPPAQAAPDQTPAAVSDAALAQESIAAQAAIKRRKAVKPQGAGQYHGRDGQAQQGKRYRSNPFPPDRQLDSNIGG